MRNRPEDEETPFSVKTGTFTQGDTSPKMAVAKVNDLIPSFRPKLSMISDEKKGEETCRRVNIARGRRVGRWDHIWHPDSFWKHVGGVEGVH